MTGKKIGIVFLSLFLVFLGFLSGLFVGRTTANNVYLYSPSQTVSTTAPSETVWQTETTYQNNSTTPPSTGKEELRLNLNEASKEELMEIPGIGEVLAQRILDFRQMYGPFYSVDELDEVDGIGEKRLEDLRRYLFVEEIK